jgi:hypothetical protein
VFKWQKKRFQAGFHVMRKTLMGPIPEGYMSEMIRWVSEKPTHVYNCATGETCPLDSEMIFTIGYVEMRGPEFPSIKKLKEHYKI